MVMVPVRRDQIVEMCETCIFGGLHDAVGVSELGAARSGVDQGGIAGGRYEERGVPTFHIIT
jgi:hypothetical protein